MSMIINPKRNVRKRMSIFTLVTWEKVRRDRKKGEEKVDKRKNEQNHKNKKR